MCKSSHLFYTCKSQPSLLLIQFGFPDAIMFKTKGYYTWCFVSAALRNLLEVRMIYDQQATINTRYFLWCKNWSIPTEILHIYCRKIMAGKLKCFDISQPKVICPVLMNLMDRMNKQTRIPRIVAPPTLSQTNNSLHHSHKSHDKRQQLH